MGSTIHISGGALLEHIFRPSVVRNLWAGGRRPERVGGTGSPLCCCFCTHDATSDRIRTGKGELYRPAQWPTTSVAKDGVERLGGYNDANICIDRKSRLRCGRERSPVGNHEYAKCARCDDHKDRNR